MDICESNEKQYPITAATKRDLKSFLEEAKAYYNDDEVRDNKEKK